MAYHTIKGTIDYYEDNAIAYASETVDVDMKKLYPMFVSDLPKQDLQHILDLGCGSGRDANYFAGLGYEVTAVDGSSRLIEWARQQHASNRINWHTFRFDDIKRQNWRHEFTGIWACASLLHVPYAELPSLLNTLIDTLTKSGILYASFKYGDSERLDDGRFFYDMNEAHWVDIATKINCDICSKIWITEDNRIKVDTKWFNVALKESIENE